MYTFLKRLLIEILTAIMSRQADKIGEREKLNDEEIIKKYGEGTIIFKTFYIESVLTTFNFLNILLVFCITVTIIGTIALRILVPEQFHWKVVALLLLYIPIIISCKIVRTIYETKKDIITKENIIMQRAFKEDRIITYDEIKKANKINKIKIKMAIVYIPLSRGYLQIPMADVTGDLALIKIRHRSNIYIPEFTENRKKYMSQASHRGLYNFFGFLFLGASLTAAALSKIRDGGMFLKILVTVIPVNFFFFSFMGCIVIAKGIFMLGQYKLKKDINDPERVSIKVF